MQVELPDGDAFRTFFLDIIAEETVTAVRVVLRDGRGPDSQVLDEHRLDVGGELERTRTDPAFGMSVVAVHDSLNGTCR